MNVTYEQIREANETIKTMTLERKNRKTGKVTKNEYAEVHQRVKAFRMVYPGGRIITDMVQNDDKMCIFRATIYDENMRPLATGTAYEIPHSTPIVETSLLECAETSAIGRALGFAGFGIDVAIASKEEAENAFNQQDELERRKEDELRRKIDELEFVPEDKAALPLTSVQLVCLKNLLDDAGVPAAFVFKKYYPNTKKIEDLNQNQGVIIKRNIARISADYQKKESKS